MRFLTTPNVTLYITLLQNCYVWWCSDKETPSEFGINPCVMSGLTETNLADVGSILLSDPRGILAQPSSCSLFLSAVPPLPAAVRFINESFRPFAIWTNLFPVNGNKFTLNWNLRFTNLSFYLNTKRYFMLHRGLFIHGKSQYKRNCLY